MWRYLRGVSKVSASEKAAPDNSTSTTVHDSCEYEKTRTRKVSPKWQVGRLESNVEVAYFICLCGGGRQMLFLCVCGGDWASAA